MFARYESIRAAVANVQAVRLKAPVTDFKVIGPARRKSRGLLLENIPWSWDEMSRTPGAMEPPAFRPAILWHATENR